MAAAKKPERPVTRAREPAAEWVAVSNLAQWPDNPRKNDQAVDAVADSIKRFGFGAPILARKADGEIIAGHTRLKAAAKLGIDRVPVRYLDLDPADAHLLALADNKIGEKADWDDEALGKLLADLDEESRAATGFDDAEISKLLDGLSGDEDNDPDEVPDPPKNPVTKPGDIWILGDHRLLCGDCRVAEDVARLCDGERVNVAFTSPPYASQRKYDESSGFKPIHPDSYVEWFEPVQANVRSVLADDGSWFVNIKEHCEGGQRHLYVKDLTMAHARKWGWAFVDELVWHKTAVPGRWSNRLRNAWEPVFHFALRTSIKFDPKRVAHHSDRAVIGSGGSPKNAGGNWSIPDQWAREGATALPSNVISIGTGGSSSTHSAAFPVNLPSFFIKAYSDPGDRIFDPFMGSGTVIVAAEQQERRGIGIEISPRYCDVIVQRWEKLTGRKAERRGRAA